MKPKRETEQVGEVLPVADTEVDAHRRLLRELCSHGTEAEWLEFKKDNQNLPKIGEYISAIANSAALCRKENGYLVWGIQDGTHEVVGTTFDPQHAKKGNEDLIPWLSRLLVPSIEFRFLQFDVDRRRIVILEIPRAERLPQRFDGTEYLRVGSYKKKLKDFPEKERRLWKLFDTRPFEQGIAQADVSAERVVEALDCQSYFDLLGLPQPRNQTQVLAALAGDGLVERSKSGTWNILNLGTILLAKRVNDFTSLERKAVRVIRYKGKSRLQTIKEKINFKGYAAGFDVLTEYVDALLPEAEVVGRSGRHTTPAFPNAAVREVIANALIHQDFATTGTGPMVEVFDNRIEVTNPGIPLVDTSRFVDAPPRSRNDKLAGLMRRFRFCEERGSGIDKVVAELESAHLPAPRFEVCNGNTRITLFSRTPFSQMSRRDRIDACYLHACLRYVSSLDVTTASVRERFGLPPEKRSAAARVLRDSVDCGRLIVAGRDRGSLLYLPRWAG